MVTVTLTNAVGRIDGADRALLDEISDICSFMVQGAENSQRYKKHQWDGRKRLFNKRKREFPMGLWARVQQLLQIRNVDFSVVDERSQVAGDVNIAIQGSVEWREYQREAAEAAIKARRSVLQVATGGGKTIIAALIMSMLKCRTIFMVHTKDLLYQAKKSFEDVLGQDIGQVGDGIVDVKPVTVATIQTVSKYLGIKYEKYRYDDSDDCMADVEMNDTNAEKIRKMLADAGLVIWDEVHRIACDMAYEVSAAIDSAPYRVGLSASPWRDDGADLMIEAAMGHTSYVVSASYLIEHGYLVPPVIKMVRVPAKINWGLDTASYDTIYRREIVENEYRNQLIVDHAVSFLEMGIPTLILVQFIKHGQIIKRMLEEQFDRVTFLSGRDSSMVRNATIQEVRDGDRLCLIASTIADEGLDIKRLTGLILAGGGKSSTRALQRIGRVLRPFPGKTHALVVDFLDEAKYLRDHAMRRMQIYRTEQRFEILEL